MRRALRTFLASFLGLPALGSALVILSVPPMSGLLPAGVEAAIRALSAPAFDLIARLPRGSIAGRLFYGSYEPLLPIFGDAALAVHAFVLTLPVLALMGWLLRGGPVSRRLAPSGVRV